jgi:hypothetical protein
MAALANDPIRYVAVVGAFFPDMIREAIKDAVAEAGMTEEDLREIARKGESPAPDQQIARRQTAPRRRAVAPPVRVCRKA